MNRPKGGCYLCGSTSQTFQYDWDGLEQNLEIQKQVPVLDIEIVQRHCCIKRRVMTRIHLPQPCNARSGIKSTKMFKPISPDLVEFWRARTDQTHVPSKNVPQLWKLIQAVLSKEHSKARYAWIIRYLKKRSHPLVEMPQTAFLFVRPRHHGSEFITNESSAFFAYAGCSIKNWADRIQLD